jgi:hypothetical protein
VAWACRARILRSIFHRIQEWRRPVGGLRWRIPALDHILVLLGGLGLHGDGNKGRVLGLHRQTPAHEFLVCTIRPQLMNKGLDTMAELNGMKGSTGQERSTDALKGVESLNMAVVFPET